MKRKLRCAQQWQAEAIEDGRLSGAERESFERHAVHCETCWHELEDLVRLREIMGQASVVESSPFEHRHLRMELLRRADSALDRSKTVSVRRAIVFAMAAAACVLVVIFSGRFSTTHSSIADTIAAPAFDVVESGPARWSSERLGTLARVNLADGAVWVHVQRTRSEQRFVLTLPDGEIEVHGTRFLTAVGNGNTNHVEVSEGVVSLRLHGEPDRMLRAGEAWNRSIAQAEPAAVSAVGAAAAAPEKGSEVRSPKTARTTAAPEPTVDPFVAGVRAFRSGDYASADELLARFVREMPTDPRIEDAFFLRAVANARQGKKAFAADLARSYLARFPRGLRRPEAARIAGQGGELQK